MQNPIVTVRNLRKSWSDKHVIQDMNLSVPAGSVHALLGPNGAGKTTLVRIMSTLVAPDSGSVTIAGHDVVADPHKVRSVISVTGQFSSVEERMTGAENLRLIANLLRIPSAEARSSIQQLLEELELLQHADSLVQTYSGGMKRKLDLAMSLISRPSVLFLDEPTTGLDPRSRSALWDIVRNLRDQGVTIFLTTQYLEEADQLADRISLLNHGRIVVEGTARELKRQIETSIMTLSFRTDYAASQAASLLAGSSIGPTLSNELRLSTDGSTADVHRILNSLEANGILAERLTLNEPSLDEVFLQLTGATPERKAAS